VLPGFWIGTTVQALPFQRSARIVALLGDVPRELPTASQADALTQEIASGAGHHADQGDTSDQCGSNCLRAAHLRPGPGQT
jgi:hypothetical protein